MKYSQKRWTLISRFAIVGGIFLALFVVGYYTGLLRENCHSDLSCFEQRARECRPSDFVYTQSNNVYVYSVGSSIGDCHLSVILKRVEAGAPSEFQQLEGKTMTCVIPKNELNDFAMDHFDRYMTSCHGLLKEGLYEIILTRVYSHLVGQMDDVLREAEKALQHKE